MIVRKKGYGLRTRLINNKFIHHALKTGDNSLTLSRVKARRILINRYSNIF